MCYVRAGILPGRVDGVLHRYLIDAEAQEEKYGYLADGRFRISIAFSDKV